MGAAFSVMSSFFFFNGIFGFNGLLMTCSLFLTEAKRTGLHGSLAPFYMKEYSTAQLHFFLQVADFFLVPHPFNPVRLLGPIRLHRSLVSFDPINGRVP